MSEPTRLSETVAGQFIHGGGDGLRRQRGIILKEGTLEVMQNRQTNRVETGGVIFCAANEPHGWRNVGTNRAVYYVVKWVPPDQLKAKPQ